MWQPIRPSRKDKLSDGTIEQLATNNAANEAICGKRPVPKRIAANAH